MKTHPSFRKATSIHLICLLLILVPFSGLVESSTVPSAAAAHLAQGASSPAECGFGFARPSGSPIDLGFGSPRTHQSMAVADLNLDGTPDFAVAQPDYERVMVVLGDGAGGVASSNFFDTEGLSFSVAVGDFNVDGKPDLVTVNQGSASILLGDGAGKFVVAAGSPVMVEIYAFTAAVGDFNLDGKPDLAIVSDNVTILLGDGAGGLSELPSSPVPVGTYPVLIVVGDFDLDGKPDLVIANAGSDNVTILLGDGAGGFSEARRSLVRVGTNPQSIVVGDFDLDGKPDLATANYGSDNVTVLMGNGEGGFSEAAGSPVSVRSPVSIAVGDFNLDGMPDLAVLMYSPAMVTVLRGNGAGRFDLVAAAGVGAIDPFYGPFGYYPPTPDCVAVGDFNRDGRLDFAAADEWYVTPNDAVIAADVTILLSTCEPAVTSVMLRGASAQRIVVVGSGFTDSTKVFIDDVAFASPPAVSHGGNKLVQKGTLANGMSINDAIPSGREVFITFRRHNGELTTVPFTRQ